jgi:hypothetical protein
LSDEFRSGARRSGTPLAPLSSGLLAWEGLSMASHVQFGAATSAGPTFNGRPADAETSGPPGSRSAPTWSLTAVGLGVIGAVIALLAGGWLMFAPFALGYQNDFSSWSDATKTDFWDGFGLAILGLAALVLTGLALLGALRQAGVITTRTRPAAAPGYEPATVTAAAVARTPNDELTSVLRPLLEALERDNAEAASGSPRRPGGPNASSGPTPSGGPTPLGGPYPANTPYQASNPYPPSSPYPAGNQYPAGKE